jgi:hypothetical protein
MGPDWSRPNASFLLMEHNSLFSVNCTKYIKLTNNEIALGSVTFYSKYFDVIWFVDIMLKLWIALNFGLYRFNLMFLMQLPSFCDKHITAMKCRVR